MGRIKFDFDDHNLDHIARHDVARREVIQAFRGRNVIIPGEEINGELRFTLFGKTAKKRFLVVVFTLRKGWVRPITAYTMNRKERVLYAKDLD